MPQNELEPSFTALTSQNHASKATAILHEYDGRRR
jgi:hypothetical protein